MAEQAQGNGPLSAAVTDVATGVALALRGEGDPYALSALLAADEEVALAAVRVLGADVLAPYALGTRGEVRTPGTGRTSHPGDTADRYGGAQTYGGRRGRYDGPGPHGGSDTYGDTSARSGTGSHGDTTARGDTGSYGDAGPHRDTPAHGHPGPHGGADTYGGTEAYAHSGGQGGDRLGDAGSSHRADESVVRKALAAYPPKPGASEVSVWSYHGLAEASRAYLPGSAGGWPAGPRAGADWVRGDPWPELAHRASQLAALCLPGLAPALAEALGSRTDDLARGFVRAVRRRDWLQAAGVGRWLSRMPGVPGSLGLDSGLVFVRRMSDGDPRVALHLTAAQRFHGLGG